MDQAARRWAGRLAATRPEVARIGYFGSYARGDWGPGSDLDVIVVVRHAEEPFDRRPVRWNALDLPVPTDVLVYTEAEWRSLAPESRFLATVMREAIWVYSAD